MNVCGSRRMGLFLVIAAAFLFAAPGCGKKEEQAAAGAAVAAKPELLCYAGGTMRPAMEELVKRYKAKTGEKIALDSAGSGELLVKFEQTQLGDLFVCHDPFFQGAMK